MNADPYLDSGLNSPFSMGLHSDPVVIGEPIKYASRMVRLVSIKKSHSISDRVSWSNVELTVVRGTCEVCFDNEKITLSSQESIAVPAMVEHSIFAKKDVRVVVSFQLGCSAQSSQTPPPKDQGD